MKDYKKRFRACGHCHRSLTSQMECIKFIHGLKASHPSSLADLYTAEQVDRMNEAIMIWRASQPLDLIKRVNEIQEESVGVDELVGRRPENRPKVVGLVERLKELHDSKSRSDQEALEEWRRKKLEEAKRRSEAVKAKQNEYV